MVVLVRERNEGPSLRYPHAMGAEAKGYLPAGGDTSVKAGNHGRKQIILQHMNSVSLGAFLLPAQTGVVQDCHVRSKTRYFVYSS
jgi:hypothetical protein